MASAPSVAMTPLSRAEMTDNASSHDARRNLPSPFDPTRICGYSKRPSWYVRSRYFETFVQRKPRVKG